MVDPRDSDEPTGIYGGPPVEVDTGSGDESTQITSLDQLDVGPGATLGEFRIEAKIGEGAMGTVFSAVHPMIAKRAAIKVLKHSLCADTQMIERFIDEARVVNQIGHPNIVDIFAFGEMPDGRRYLAMEWLRGETLRERIKRGRMGITAMARVIRPLARALEAAHDKQVIHRDLKPENIFLVEVPHDEPHVKLLDFGIAKLVGEKGGFGESGPLQILGTPAYIAPEQARNADDAGPASDLYSLGAIAFELLTGRPPFGQRSTIELVTAALEEAPVAPSTLNPEIPDEIDRLVLDMLAKAPADRPSLSYVRSMLDLVRDPSEMDDRPRSIVPRLRTDTPPAGTPQISELIESEVLPAYRTSAPVDEPQVAVRFAKRSAESPPLPMVMPVAAPPPLQIRWWAFATAIFVVVVVIAVLIHVAL